MTAINDFATLLSTGSVKADRVTLNNNFLAVMGFHYSDDASAPPVTTPGMIWIDASAGYVKQRDDSDAAWNVVGTWAGSDAPAALGVLGVKITKDTEGTTASNTIRFTLQVTDARANAAGAVDIAGRRHLLVAISTSSFGAPAGTQTVAAGSTGVVLQELTSDQLMLVETDANGAAEIDVTVSGSGDRYLRASVGDSAVTELQGTWA